MSRISLPVSLGQARDLTRGQLLDLVLDVETALRGFLISGLSKRGSEWTAQIPKSIRHELQSMEASAGDAGRWRKTLLDYATLQQLISILGSQWKLFSPPLEDRKATHLRLDRLRERRNDLAHGLQPDANDKVRILVIIDEVVHELSLVPPAWTVRAAQTSVATPTVGLLGRRVMWADEQPENNRVERRWLEELGADVFPVLTNKEAAEQAASVRPHLVVSDIDRGGDESGALLGIRLMEADAIAPLVFYVGVVDHRLPLPHGAVGITSDPADLLQLVLRALRPIPDS